MSIFSLNISKHHTETIKEGNRELTIQLYDNGVQIRTLVTKEVATIINREVLIDRPNKRYTYLNPTARPYKKMAVLK